MRAAVLEATWDPHDGSEPPNCGRATDASRAFRDPTLTITQRDRPEPGPNDALVRVRYAGICGSDLSLLETDETGYVHYAAYASLPTVLGHEFAGEVVELGKNVTGFAVGDPVTAEVTAYCGRCPTCKRGHHGHCDRFEQLGFTVDGAFAEYVVVPERLLWNVASLANRYEERDQLLRAAALIEPATISYHGLFRRARAVDPGGYHVYHGLGPIGLTGMGISRATGAARVVGFDPQPERLAVARDLGFEYVFDPGSDQVAVIDRVTDGDGADVHVETAGAVDHTYPVIADTLADGATVVHISNAGTAASINLREYQAASAQIVGAEGHTGQGVYPRVIRLVAAGRFDPLPMVTNVYPLADAAAAVGQARKRLDGKVLLAC